jgi:hypothetical protein
MSRSIRIILTFIAGMWIITLAVFEFLKFCVIIPGRIIKNLIIVRKPL